LWAEPAIALARSVCSLAFLGHNLCVRTDASAFSEIQERLDRVVQDASLGLALDQHAWRVAQAADASHAAKIESMLESNQQGLEALLQGQEATMQVLLGTRYEMVALREEVAKLKSIVEFAHKRGVGSSSGVGSSAGSVVSAASAGASGDAKGGSNVSEVWAIDIKEVKFEYVVDPDDPDREVRRELGKGAFGAVYAGEFRGKPVAVKECRFTGDTVADTFRKEVEILHRLHHRHVAEFYGASFSMQKGYLVLERLKCSLHAALFVSAQGIRFDEPEKRRVTMEVAQGMHYLHTARPRVIHSDLKPQNVMLTAKHVVRIIDFGLATYRASSMASKTTGLKANVGTLPYMAPELLQVGAHVVRNHLVDVYAFAVTVAELFVAKEPFSGEVEHDIKEKVKNFLRPFEAELEQMVPRDVQGLVKACWQQEASKRPEFALVVAQLLTPTR
jgi:hypothetical protein